MLARWRENEVWVGYHQTRCLLLTSALQRVTKYLRVQHVKVCHSWFGAVARYASTYPLKIHEIDVWYHHDRRDLIAQELREYGICVNGYAPGTIQTDLGVCDYCFAFHSMVTFFLLMSFVAIEAEKVAGDKTIQEVNFEMSVSRLYVGVSPANDR